MKSFSHGRKEGREGEMEGGREGGIRKPYKRDYLLPYSCICWGFDVQFNGPSLHISCHRVHLKCLWPMGLRWDESERGLRNYLCSTCTEGSHITYSLLKLALMGSWTASHKNDRTTIDLAVYVHVTQCVLQYNLRLALVTLPSQL